MDESPWVSPSWWATRPQPLAMITDAAGRTLELLEFFAASPFYDRRSINESIAMQFRHRYDTPASLWLTQLEQAQAHYAGVFYRLHHAEGSFPLVDELYKANGESQAELCCVYVIDFARSAIFRMPSLRQVIRSRVESATAFAVQAFTSTQESIVSRNGSFAAAPVFEKESLPEPVITDPQCLLLASLIAARQK